MYPLSMPYFVKECANVDTRYVLHCVTVSGECQCADDAAGRIPNSKFQCGRGAHLSLHPTSSFPPLLGGCGGAIIRSRSALQSNPERASEVHGWRLCARNPSILVTESILFALTLARYVT